MPPRSSSTEIEVEGFFLQHIQHSLLVEALVVELGPHVPQLFSLQVSVEVSHGGDLDAGLWRGSLLQVVAAARERKSRQASKLDKNDRRQEEPMDWDDAPFLPEVSAPFVPSRPSRKMMSLISVQVSGPPSLSANRFPNMRALVLKVRTPQAPKVSVMSIVFKVVSPITSYFASFFI
ncbi:hypothetical protein TNCV_1090571 [Trichonephila clavipes]|uniref:Uncharacterized protein n=1 Tax=Trichonephila clavipes TaxID=2585209 RepID=A0A8X6T2N1_TRICX|nr:hypothetical protein TNCV_1090571 [Trichonephila clavipes]